MTEEYSIDEIVPIPAICTNKDPRRRHQWLDGNGNGAIKAPSLRNCYCFYCGTPLKPHPLYVVEDAYTKRRRMPMQLSLLNEVPHD